MSSNPHNPMNADSAEETLRLIASLPAPAGLEDRVHKALRAAPRSGRVLTWPTGFRARAVMQNHWMRAAAAAAIVFVVVGGGWGVYSRVQPGPAGKVIVMPQRAPSSGGFGGAGAIRTPQTLPGPSVREQATPASKDRSPGAPTGSEGASHPSGQKSPAGDPGREQGTPPAKKPAAKKKVDSAEPAAGLAAPQPAVSR